LEAVTGALNGKTVSEACNWPDVIRDEKEWEWSKPQHYVNIPRGETTYLESRDCREGLCITGAIKKYADELGDPSLDAEKRWQAFAWLCHLVADLHQPLHAGFGDDRGGNDVQVTARGKEMNLHYFWDHELSKHQVGGWKELYRHLQAKPLEPLAGEWSPKLVDAWTEESHRLAATKAYPPTPEIDEAWESQSWGVARERMRLAAARLAWILEAIIE
jgi:hypothetical protein